MATAAKVFLVKPVKETVGEDARSRLVRADKRSQVESYILGDFLIEPVTDLVAGELQSVANIQVEDAE